MVDEGNEREFKLGYELGWNAAIRYIREQMLGSDRLNLIEASYNAQYGRPVEEVLVQLAEEAEV